MIQPPQNYYLQSSSEHPALRIGVLLNSLENVPAFAAKIISDIKASNFARIELVILRPMTAPDSKQRHDLLFDLYLRLDARMKPANDPLAKVNCRRLLDGVQMLDVDFGNDHERGNAIAAETAATITSRKLDVLLNFGWESIPGEILRAAVYGVWSLQHRDPEFYRGGPPHFWEMREQSPLSGVVLQALTDETGGEVVLGKALFATEPTISVSRNRYIPYWGSADLIIQKLHELHEFGWEYVRGRALQSSAYQGKRDNYRTPRNRDILPWLGPALLKKALTYPFRQAKVQHWKIAIRLNSAPLFDPELNNYSGFRWIEPPPGHAWADPFAFEHQGKCWCFFEDYSYEKKRASIACAEISQKGEFGRPLLCLEHPAHHYSYPHVFSSGSEIFMIPESYESNSVDLYRCEVFPNQWVHEARLLEGKFVDSTIWEHEGLWWFATTSADPMPGAGFLWLYYSKSLTGNWRLHPNNPISTDIRNSRGAGRVFRSSNRLIRPSQSCAPTYGYSITFNEITELSPAHYSERPLKTITPEHWNGLAGIHTYNSAANIELVDGRSPVPVKQTSLGLVK